MLHRVIGRDFDEILEEAEERSRKMERGDGHENDLTFKEMDERNRALCNLEETAIVEERAIEERKRLVLGKGKTLDMFLEKWDKEKEK